MTFFLMIASANMEALSKKLSYQQNESLPAVGINDTQQQQAEPDELTWRKNQNDHLHGLCGAIICLLYALSGCCFKINLSMDLPIFISLMMPIAIFTFQLKDEYQTALANIFNTVLKISSNELLRHLVEKNGRESDLMLPLFVIFSAHGHLGDLAVELNYDLVNFLYVQAILAKIFLIHTLCKLSNSNGDKWCQNLNSKKFHKGHSFFNECSHYRSDVLLIFTMIVMLCITTQQFISDEIYAKEIEEKSEQNGLDPRPLRFIISVASLATLFCSSIALHLIMESTI